MQKGLSSFVAARHGDSEEDQHKTPTKESPEEIRESVHILLWLFDYSLEFFHELLRDAHLSLLGHRRCLPHRLPLAFHTFDTLGFAREGASMLR